MIRHLLYGPVSGDDVDDHIGGLRAPRTVRTFGPDPGPGVDVVVGPSAAWADLAAAGDHGWEAEAVVLRLPYQSVPPAVWDAPVPVVGLAANWNLLGAGYRHHRDRCDILLTDAPGAAALRAVGWPDVRSANLFGPGRSVLDHPWPAPADPGRDIDVLFVGNTHAAIHRSRAPWLARLARTAVRWNVVVRSGVSAADYRALLARSKLAFNHSIRGERNHRVFEAAVAGAVLLQERDNSEVPEYLTPGEEYFPYGPDDFEAVVERLLTNPDERCRIAAAAQRRAAGYSFENLLTAALERLEPDWDRLVERARNRPKMSDPDRLRLRAAFAISASHRGRDTTLVADLDRMIEEVPADPAWPLAAAVVAVAQGAREASQLDRLWRVAAAGTPDPRVLASLSHALDTAGQPTEAVAAARSAVDLLDAKPDVDLPPDPLFLPVGFTDLRVEWEQAGWDHPADPAATSAARRDLLKAHLQAQLATLTGELSHYERAAHPAFPRSYAALGCALARLGRMADAVPHLRAAVDADPFDRPAARALFQALVDTGDEAGAVALAADARLLHKAAPELVPAEPWFAGPRPTGTELASLVVLCHNQAEVTRLCLESVLHHTRRPYELIVVDNGSNDGTLALLEAVRREPGPDRVVVLRNEMNVGYPAGVNQGLEAARGEYLVLLNNDVVVTAGWLDRLVACALHDWPKVGLAGAVTNQAPPPQRVDPDYTDVAGLDAFAARHARRVGRQAMDVSRLTGFCLLVRRPVFERIGRLDERFGLGFFDDDDLCLRARKAGFRLSIALDCYVHHFGSRTFRALGVDTAKQLEGNLDLYRQKWGAEEAGKFRPLEADQPVRVKAPRPPGSPRPRVSLTMIVKNEEHHLPDCLASVRDLVDEIVVVDTGSTDRTKEIAASFGAKVFDFPWVDHFAAARNAALDHATGDWAFWMDADDRLDGESRDRLRALFDTLGDENTAYVMKCRCVGAPDSGGATTVDHVRLFPLRPEIRWKYRVHEQILPAVRKAGGEVIWSDVVVTHVGYADPAARRGKLERDLHLLNVEYAEQPDDPFTLFNLGTVYHELRDPAAALGPLERSLALSHPHDSIVRKLYALVAQCLRELDRTADALGACRRGRELYPDDGELLFLEAMILRDRRDFAGAEAALKRLIGGTENTDHFASVAEGLRTHKARHNLAVLYLDTRRPADAAREWRAVLADRPDFLPARAGLAEAALANKDWTEVEAQAVALEGMGPAGEEAAEAIRGRAKLERGEFASARWALGKAVRRFSDSVRLRNLLAHAALGEGADGPAEEALASVLELAPDHPEARFNLALVRARKALKPGEEITLTALYRAACAAGASTQAVAAVYELARKCPCVTAVGVEGVAAATALFCAQPARLVWYADARPPEFDLLKRLGTRTAFEHKPLAAAGGAVEGTDLLVLGRSANPGHARDDLARLAGAARRFVAVLGADGSNFDVPAGFRVIEPASGGAAVIVLERERK